MAPPAAGGLDSPRPYDSFAHGVVFVELRGGCFYLRLCPGPSDPRATDSTIVDWRIIPGGVGIPSPAVLQGQDRPDAASEQPHSRMFIQCHKM